MNGGNILALRLGGWDWVIESEREYSEDGVVVITDWIPVEIEAPGMSEQRLHHHQINHSAKSE